MHVSTFLVVLGGLLAGGVALSVAAQSPSTQCATRTVAVENALPGGTGWRALSTTSTPPVQGYVDTTSATCGQQVSFHLATLRHAAVPVRLEFWRLGDYRGLGGRLVWTSGRILAQHPRQWARIASATKMTSAPWPANFSVHLSSGFPQGLYEVLVRPIDRRIAPSAIPLVIRDPNQHAALTLVVATNTAQMYNTWGGHSAYSAGAARSTVVSFDRPYFGFGMGLISSEDLPIAVFAEAHGLDIDYATDVDLNANSPGLMSTNALLFGSHTEYWTSGMRSNLESATASGVNAVFLGGNNMFWRPDPLGNSSFYRQLGIWRDATSDPFGAVPARASTRWRSSPILQPEQATLGEQFGCTNMLLPLQVPGQAPLPGQLPSASQITQMGWVFQNTGATPGQQLPGVIYQETDTPDPSTPEPTGTQLVSSQTFACPYRGVPVSGWGMTIVPGAGASAGVVIDVGTRGWVCQLTATCVTNPIYSTPELLAIDANIVSGVNRNDPVVGGIIQAATLNIFDFVDRGPAAASARQNPYPTIAP